MKRAGFVDFAVILIIAFGATLLLYGWIKYPTAPLRQVNEKFFDKQNTECTVEDFRAFKVWEKSLLIFITCAFAGGILIVTIDKARQKNN